jgi:Penicillin V acylase and related amidases
VSVEQQKGLTFIDDPDLYEYTIYSSCYNTNNGILYYKTYDNHQITAVDLNKEDLHGDSLIIYPLIDEAQINFVN